MLTIEFNIKTVEGSGTTIRFAIGIDIEELYMKSRKLTEQREHDSSDEVLRE